MRRLFHQGTKNQLCFLHRFSSINIVSDFIRSKHQHTYFSPSLSVFLSFFLLLSTFDFYYILYLCSMLPQMSSDNLGFRKVNFEIEIKECKQTIRKVEAFISNLYIAIPWNMYFHCLNLKEIWWPLYPNFIITTSTRG